MADIRPKDGKKGRTYQVRYADSSAKSGYSYKTFRTMKEARAFRENEPSRTVSSRRHPEIVSVSDAVDKWLRICEKEGLDGREPVTFYTLRNYRYRAKIIQSYEWQKEFHELTTPDIVEFRSWLLTNGFSRDLASKTLSSLQSIMKEMAIRGVTTGNVAAGINIRKSSRYDTPVTIPSKADIQSLLQAADRLALSTNKQIANTWLRYRPILYLAVDSGMRPQEYLALARSAIKENGVYIDRAIDGGGHEITVTKTPAGRRFIELSNKTLDLINDYIEVHSRANDFDLVFPATNGKWLCRKNWQRRGFNSACIEAGLYEEQSLDGVSVKTAKYRPYDLRHFYASMLIEKKLNLKKIQTLMGHTNIETTLNVYGHLLEDDLSMKGDEGILSDLL